MPEHLFRLKHKLAPGDTVVFTGLIRDLKRTYGDRMAIDAISNFPDLWKHNPYLTPLRHDTPGVREIRLDYSQGITKPGQREKVHFLTWFHRNFTLQTGLPVPVLESKPDLHLSDYEKQTPPISGRYWVIFAGGKTDVTIKHWGYSRYQEVVDRLRGYGLTFVQSGAVKANKDVQHIHPPLRNALNLVGWGGIREMMWQIYHAEGVICPITCGMHMAAAFDKPCIVIAGGRETPAWEAYVNSFPGSFGPDALPVTVPHRYLHTVGLLSCCQDIGCWKSLVVPLPGKKKLLCEKPTVAENDQPLAQCMADIQVDHVVEAVLSYYSEGFLDPIGKPTHKYPQLPVTAPSAQPALTAPPTIVQQSQPAALQMLPTPAVETHKDVTQFDHPVIGGKVTVCALLYGEYYPLHRRCLDSILAAIPRERLDLRVASNAACMSTLSYLRDLPITKHYQHAENAKKYPVMREMFHDPTLPLATNYLLWFDDDTEICHRDFVRQLLSLIIANKAQQVGMFGIPLYHRLTDEAQASWFRQASWNRRRLLRAAQGNEAPNGDCIHFCTGWFWAADTRALRECDIPDARLNHNGGDITIGEQLHQGGWKLAEFNKGKQFVFTPTREKGGRRGYAEKFPWQRL
jgi:hypothetical protein